MIADVAFKTAGELAAYRERQATVKGGTMRKIIATSFVTLDGVMQAPGGPEEDTTGDFRWGGWTANYWDDKMGPIMDEFMGRPFDLLLGRRTYEIFAAYWPFINDGPEMSVAKVFNPARKYVVSTTLKKLEWENSELVQGDPVKGLLALKKEAGPEIQVHGSANLLQTLLKHDLLDGLRVWTFPLTLGRGKKLFDGGAVPAAFRLTSCRFSDTGVIVADYERAGEVRPGSFVTGEPTAQDLARRRKWAGGK